MLFNPSSKNQKGIVIIDPHISILNKANNEKYESGIVTSASIDGKDIQINTSTPLRPKLSLYSFDSSFEQSGILH